MYESLKTHLTFENQGQKFNKVKMNCSPHVHTFQGLNSILLYVSQTYKNYMCAAQTLFTYIPIL